MSDEGMTPTVMEQIEAVRSMRASALQHRAALKTIALEADANQKLGGDVRLAAEAAVIDIEKSILALGRLWGQLENRLRR